MITGEEMMKARDAREERERRDRLNLRTDGYGLGMAALAAHLAAINQDENNS